VKKVFNFVYMSIVTDRMAGDTDVANLYRYLINLWVKYMNIINHKAL